MPRFAWVNPRDQDPERAQLVQAYMVLHSQQTSVRRRLSAPPTTSSAPASPRSSPSHSPIRTALSGRSGPFATHPPSYATYSAGLSQSRSPPRSPRSPYTRRPSVPSVPPIAEVPEEADEEKLFELNARIRSTLTDLLNCDSVKGDERMRAWVQTRLVDVQTVALHRRRRSFGTPGGLGADDDDEKVRKLSL